MSNSIVTVKSSKTLRSAKLRMTIQLFVGIHEVYIQTREIFAYTSDRLYFKFYLGTSFLFFFCICIGDETFQSFFLGDTSFSKESWLWVKYRPFEIKDRVKVSSLCTILCLQEGLQRCRRKKNCAHSPAAFSQWTSDTFHGPLILYQNVLTQILDTAF